jgi:sensor histidine kinase regulating citrate/malate metabolism
LKHQIAALRMEKDDARRGEWLDEMEEDIKKYEAENKTGNAVLDILLTGRSLQCQRQGITLTCVADGTLLDFIGTMDLCAIVGNALDNAIESTSRVTNPEERLIHLSLSAQRGFVLFHLENYFGGSLSFEDGLPQTTKADKDFHGFGVKSIRDTVERYGGSLTMEVERGWFILKALFPRQEPHEQNHQK